MFSSRWSHIHCLYIPARMLQWRKKKSIIWRGLRENLPLIRTWSQAPHVWETPVLLKLQWNKSHRVRSSTHFTHTVRTLGKRGTILFDKVYTVYAVLALHYKFYALLIIYTSSCLITVCNSETASFSASCRTTVLCFTFRWRMIYLVILHKYFILLNDNKLLLLLLAWLHE